MAALKFVDSHNMVAYLERPTDSDDFTEIVDFLNANPIRYALTVNHTIYVSCIEEFWSTAKAQTINEETQSSKPIDLVADQAVLKERGDSLERATTTASSLEAEQ
ncbi:hypothetical protein Tco_1285892, partial [Tanacetum coccineum]